LWDEIRKELHVPGKYYCLITVYLWHVHIKIYTFLLLLRRVHIRECVPLWCEDFDEFRSDSGNTGFAVAPAYRVGVSGPLYRYFCWHAGVWDIVCIPVACLCVSSVGACTWGSVGLVQHFPHSVHLRSQFDFPYSVGLTNDLFRSDWNSVCMSRPFMRATRQINLIILNLITLIIDASTTIWIWNFSVREVCLTHLYAYSTI
jgi:hypothetical protein